MGGGGARSVIAPRAAEVIRLAWRQRGRPGAAPCLALKGATPEPVEGYVRAIGDFRASAERETVKDAFCNL